jgi:hypothetical protein
MGPAKVQKMIQNVCSNSNTKMNKRSEEAS